MPTNEEITRHHDADPDENPWVLGPPKPTVVEIVEYNEDWPDRFAMLADGIRTALGDGDGDGDVALAIDHIGSTSVPGLAAKDVIDISLTVPDSADEARYVPQLERLGYVLTIREPSFHQHRCLSLADPRVNLHVFGPDSPETIRQLMFRDWLRTHPDDRELYEQAKRQAIPGGGHVMDYNRRKQDVIREIYDRMFRAAGLL